jgi:hypothetical protein
MTDPFAPVPQQPAAQQPQPAAWYPQTGQPAGDAAATPPAQPPAAVVQAAAAKNLGTLRRAQAGHNPIANFLTGLAASAGLFLLLLGLSWLYKAVPFFLFRWAGLAICPAMVVTLIYSFIALFGGFKGTWRYDNGLAYRKNGKVSTLAWNEIDQVLLWRAGGNTSLRGKLLSWVVVGYDGTKIDIDKKTDESFGEEICAIVAAHGRSIVESGPYSGRLRK